MTMPATDGQERLHAANAGMRIASGKVIGRRVELDADLPEGASVTALALEGDEPSRRIRRPRGWSSKRLRNVTAARPRP